MISAIILLKQNCPSQCKTNKEQNSTPCRINSYPCRLTQLSGLCAELILFSPLERLEIFSVELPL